MQIVEDQQETEEQAAARIRLVRSRKALAAAPMLAYQLRWDATPLDGRTERGVLPELRTPMLTGLTDAADELYVDLQRWVAIYAADLEVPAPEGWSWRNPNTAYPMGLRADATPETASILVSSAASWLLWHEAAIAALPDAAEFHDDVAALVWSLRAAAGMIRPHRRSEIVTISTRRCENPLCHSDEVRVEYFGEPMAYAEARGDHLRPVPLADETEDQMMNRFASIVAGVSVRCAVCGWAPEVRPSKIAKWLS